MRLQFKEQILNAAAINSEVNLLFEIVEKVLGTTKEDIKSENRAREFVNARRMMGAILMDRYNPTIGYDKLSGYVSDNPDHSKFINWNNTHASFMETGGEKAYQENFKRIKKIFYEDTHNSEIGLVETIKIYTQQLSDIKFKKHQAEVRLEELRANKKTVSV